MRQWARSLVPAGGRRRKTPQAPSDLALPAQRRKGDGLRPFWRQTDDMPMVIAGIGLDMNRSAEGEAEHGKGRSDFHHALADGGGDGADVLPAGACFLV